MYPERDQEDCQAHQSHDGEQNQGILALPALGRQTERANISFLRRGLTLAGRRPIKRGPSSYGVGGGAWRLRCYALENGVCS